MLWDWLTHPHFRKVNKSWGIPKRKPTSGDITGNCRTSKITWKFCFSVTKLCPALCDPMDCSTEGFPVLFYLPEFAQTHVHWIDDSIQPTVAPFSPCAQSFPGPVFLPMNWLAASGGQSTGASASASVLPRNIQDRFPLRLIGLMSFLSKGVFSISTVQKHKFFSAQPSLWSNSHIYSWLLEKP